MTQRQAHHSMTTSHAHATHIEWLNASLIVLAVACLLYYVIAANGLAAQAWRFTSAQNELTTLLDQRNGLVTRQAVLEDRSVLATLAADVGMVPAGAVVYLVQNQPVAAR